MQWWNGLIGTCEGAKFRIHGNLMKEYLVRACVVGLDSSQDMLPTSINEERKDAAVWELQRNGRNPWYTSFQTDTENIAEFLPDFNQKMNKKLKVAEWYGVIQKSCSKGILEACGLPGAKRIFAINTRTKDKFSRYLVVIKIMYIKHKICHIYYKNADFEAIFLQKDVLTYAK